MSTRTPREIAQEIVWQWMTTSLDDFTRSCIDDRGITLIEAIAAALTYAEGLAEALEPVAAMLRVIVERLDRLDGKHTAEIDTILALARVALAAFREKVEP